MTDSSTSSSTGTQTGAPFELPRPAPVGGVDREFAEQLVDQARAQGVELVGPNGLLGGLTKQVLEAGLEAEMSEHLGYERHDPAGHTAATRATALVQRP